MTAETKFEMMKMSGQIVEVLLMPATLGGDPANPLNRLWLYKNAAQQKNNFDQELIRLIEERGGRWQYAAKPSYEGENTVPERLSLTSASEFGVLELVISNTAEEDPRKMPVFTEGTAPQPADDGLFGHLLVEYAAAAFDKQLRIADFLGEGWSWQLDTTSGVLTITQKGGGKILMPVQILGSESQHAGTWLWSWANEESALPPKMVAAALALRRFGETNGIREFTEPEIPVDYLPGDVISMVGVGLSDSCGYFRGPYDGGAVFLLIEQIPGMTEPPHPVARISTVFPQVLSALPIPNHEKAFDSYVRYYHFETRSEPGCVIATHAQFGELIGEFDELHRMTNLKGTAKPLKPAPV